RSSQLSYTRSNPKGNKKAKPIRFGPIPPWFLWIERQLTSLLIRIVLTMKTTFGQTLGIASCSLIIVARPRVSIGKPRRFQPGADATGGRLRAWRRVTQWHML